MPRQFLKIENIVVQPGAPGDIFSKADPFARITVGDTVLRTGVKWDCDCVKFRGPFMFAYDMPARVTIEIIDADHYSPDDTMLMAGFAPTDLAKSRGTAQAYGISVDYEHTRVLTEDEYAEIQHAWTILGEVAP